MLSWLLVKAELLDMAPWTTPPPTESQAGFPTITFSGRLRTRRWPWGACEDVGVTDRPGVAGALHSVWSLTDEKPMGAELPHAFSPSTHWTHLHPSQEQREESRDAKEDTK